MWQNDLAWYLFFRRNRRAVGRMVRPLLAVLLLGGIAYAVLMVSTALERIH